MLSELAWLDLTQVWVYKQGCRKCACVSVHVCMRNSNKGKRGKDMHVRGSCCDDFVMSNRFFKAVALCVEAEIYAAGYL